MMKLLQTRRCVLFAFAVMTTKLLKNAAGLMYDVLEPNKVPPSSCKEGCTSWAKLDTSYDRMWSDLSLKTIAGTSCAQPGMMVNNRPYGSWCFCANSSSSSRDKDHIAATFVDPLHPFDNQTLLIYNTFDGEDMFASFAYTDAPPTETSAQQWIRLTYPEQKDAMPLRFVAVEGINNTYIMHNEWSGYESWVGYDANTDHGEPYLHGTFTNKNDALKVRLEPASLPTEYIMIDVDASVTNGQTTYVSFCTSACDDGKWWKSGYTDLSDAMTFKLVPSGSTMGSWDYCTSKNGVPEQINIQIADPLSVVVSFVTFESAPPQEPPVVTVNNKDITGVTHVHKTEGGRVYYMHFVRLSNLMPGEEYMYTVHSGATDAVTSDVFSFRGGPSPGNVTRVNIYGDMGVYTWNNMGNILDDCNSGAADLIVHMGDHAYNEGESDEKRGDGYMSAWQRALSNCTWAPVVGNHEFYDGAELGRFLNQTWEGWGPIAGGNVPTKIDTSDFDGRSTATSALGALLSTGNFHAVAHSQVLSADQGINVESTAKIAAEHRKPHPSNTSRYYSFDYGLVHFIALDLNVYYGTDTCGDECRLAQLEWLEEDLKLVNMNRGSTPWVMAMSHFPFYCTGCYAKQASSMWYASNGAEFHGNVNATAAAAARECALNGSTKLSDDELHAWNTPISAGSDASIKDLVPILQKYSVDVYIAGHWHYYESLYPSTIGSTGVGGDPLQKDFFNPNVTVHITTGNGGPPSKDSFVEDCPGPDCGSIPGSRYQSTEYGYGRFVVHNSTHVEYSQWRNSNSTLVDSFWIVQETHGAFPPQEQVSSQ